MSELGTVHQKSDGEGGDFISSLFSMLETEQDKLLV
jgi:hypothetical protein